MGVETLADHHTWPLIDSLDELGQLTRSAGADVVGLLTQKLSRPTAAYYLGKGKLQELVDRRAELGYDLVVFDDELLPRQQRNLEEALKVKVIDRSALILDIFAKRAHTHEGRLQVELAQHEYLLPRLAGQWSHLERLGGGIGTRGPGEAQLETDRRLIRRKITNLKRQLEEVRRHRALYRAQRSAEGLAIVALVGYTNAGKSTLFNALTNAQVVAEDRPFDTLDPTTRRLTLPSGQEILLTDTVGFIQKLPPTLVAAFRATLEELDEADLLLHVLDITQESAAEQSQTVEEILRDLGLNQKPRLVAFNKLDLLVPPGEVALDDEALERLPEELGFNIQGGGLISAQKEWGLRQLLQLIEERLARSMMEITVEIPYAAGHLINLFRQQGSVEHQDYGETGIRLQGKIPPRLQAVFRDFQVSSPSSLTGRTA